MKHFILCLGVASVIGVGTGCGVKKNLDEMHDSTVSMSSTTKEMAKTTADMARMTAEMREIIGNTYADMRIASAREARQAAQLDGLNRAEDMAPKLGYAGEFYASMEFHFWKPQVETEKERLDMMELAVKDYFYKVREYIRDRRDTSIPIIQDNASENLFAMAAMIHFVNPVQTKMLERFAGSGIKEVSMYSMIEDGLRMKKSLMSGEISENELLPYQKQVLIFEQEAVYMLQVRQNFLKAFAYILMSNSEEGNQQLDIHSFKDFAKLKNMSGLLKVGKTLLLGTDWQPNFASRTTPQINLDAEILEHGAAAMELLREVGYKPAKDSKLEKLYKNIDTKATYRNIQFSVEPAKQAKVRSIQRVENAIKRILK